MSGGHIIRWATPDDAAPLSRLAERTFREAFSAENSAEDMDLHCARAYGEAQQHAEITDGDWTTLVVEADGRLIAYAQLRRGPAPACVEAAAPVEIHRIYVDRPWHGRGVAHELMTELLRTAESTGADKIWLGVWERNPRALAFYDKWHFEEIGDHVYTVGKDPQRDLVLVRRAS